MDPIKSIKKDKAYIKYKIIVKSWEKDFKTKYSRTPSKFDIKEAPSNIKYAYKKYFHLKSAALEHSLSIYDDDDEPFGSPEPTQENVACIALSPLSDSSSHPDLLLLSLPTGREIEKLLSQAPSKEVQSNELKPLSPFTVNLSKKLFESRKFSIRNPRKSLLTKSQSINEEKICSLDKENTEDEYNTQPESEKLDLTELNASFNSTLNNTLIVNRNNSFIGNHSHISNQHKAPVTRNVNEAWLQRATGTNCDEQQTHNSAPNATESLREPIEKFGIANIKIPILATNSEKNKDFVENSESESEDLVIDKLKPALKKRKITLNKAECTLFESHNETLYYEDKNETLNMMDINTTTNKPSKILKAKVSVRNRKKTAPIKIQHDKDEQPPDIAEYIPFGFDDKLTPRISNPKDILKVVQSSGKTSNIDTSKNKQVENIEKKIRSGSLNDNFVKINIEKKVFVRGKKSINFSKYKKQQWKDKKALHAGMEFPGGKMACFKCGAHGHMARYCTAHKGDTLLPLQSYDDSNILTLEDMQNIVSKETNNMSLSEQLSMAAYTSSQIPDSFMKLLTESPCQSTGVKPIYSNHQQETPAALYEALQKFGHDFFRPGQKQAIMRILCGMSSLLILSTGGGKSLCYQLPAYIYSQHYKCITLVISPLVSLMEDQVLSMPEFLKAGCLHTNQPTTQRKKIIQFVKDGAINVLLISPEALISGDNSHGFVGLFKSLPPIAFACIDEAHCVSQWSHNFRPSYLMICRVLREKLNVKCILGLTATASQATITSVISHINIPDSLSGVIKNPTLPDNLCLSVSLEKDKDRALISLINSERISAFNSIIVYCIRRDECERVASIMRSCLQEPGKINMEKQNNKRKRMSYIAEAYHAGMSAAQRKKIQKHFMDGTLRIIVATVAFGMGINKANIRCIIHYNMPSSFESYVQEVGRAGRDGEYAFCHVLMNNSNNDKNELLKHIHANTIDRPSIRKLLQKVFIPCQCASTQDVLSNTTANSRCKGHEVGIPIDSTVEELDLPSENISTMLCYVELHSKQYIKVLHNAYTMCKISSYGGPEKILVATKDSPPLAMAYLLESKKDPDVTKRNILEFDVIHVASAIGWESGMTKYHLKNLEWISEGGSSRRSQLKVEFNTLGFRVKAPGDLSPGELDSILDDLHGIVLLQEKAMLYQLEESNKAFRKLGNYSLESNSLPEESLMEKSNELKNIIINYFQRENHLPTDVKMEDRPLDVERVASDVRALISSYRDCTFTGRSIARIFQGISSPNYPAIVWGRCKFWRSHLHEDFYGIMKIATQQIIQLKIV